MKNKLKLFLAVISASTTIVGAATTMYASVDAPNVIEVGMGGYCSRGDEAGGFEYIKTWKTKDPSSISAETIIYLIELGYFKDYIDDFKALGYIPADYGAPATTPAPVEKPAHTHEYTSEVTRDASCVEEGETTYSCSCGNTYSEPIAMTEHVYGDAVVVTEATCTQAGEVVKTCTGCGNEIKEELPVVAHVESEWKVTVEPTCTGDGEEAVVCSVCDEVLDSRVIEATGHTESDWTVVKASTLFKSGESQIQCISCGEVLETAVVPVNMTYWYCIAGVACVAVLGGIFFVVKKKK